jgi:hypothetical protein
MMLLIGTSSVLEKMIRLARALRLLVAGSAVSVEDILAYTPYFDNGYVTPLTFTVPTPCSLLDAIIQCVLKTVEAYRTFPVTVGIVTPAKCPCFAHALHATRFTAKATFL